MATSLQIEVEDGPVRVVRLVGELDVDSGRRSRATLDLAISKALQPTVVVDLSELSFCDSSGVRILLALHRLAADAGRELRIRDVMPSVALVLNLTGADRVLVAAADREAP
jgi:anti-anti-sigma factor